MTAHSRGFHEGERAVQQRVGVAERMAEIGAVVIRPAMPEQHSTFFAQLPFVLLGGRGAAGQPWGTAVAGPPGFVHAPDATHLVLAAPRDPDDPVIGEGLRVGADLGLLGIEPHTRRRNRANGVVTAMSDAALSFEVRESFGNCPKYIHARRARFDPSPRASSQVRRGRGVDDRLARIVARADTCFLATAHPSGNVDISHRGGPAGFVQVEGDTLSMPDYRGNFFFNTLGNLALDPRCGLLWIDFDRGDLWHVSARVEIVWEGPALARHPGAQRVLHFTVDEVVERSDALAVRWDHAEPSPHLP